MSGDRDEGIRAADGPGEQIEGDRAGSRPGPTVGDHPGSAPGDPGRAAPSPSPLEEVLRRRSEGATWDALAGERGLSREAFRSLVRRWQRNAAKPQPVTPPLLPGPTQGAPAPRIEGDPVADRDDSRPGPEVKMGFAHGTPGSAGQSLGRGPAQTGTEGADSTVEVERGAPEHLPFHSTSAGLRFENLRAVPVDAIIVETRRGIEGGRNGAERRQRAVEAERTGRI